MSVICFLWVSPAASVSISVSTHLGASTASVQPATTWPWTAAAAQVRAQTLSCQLRGKCVDFWFVTLTSDLFRSDIDECGNQMHNCTADQVCVNTFGGFQCVTVECPYMKNATYIKTSPM